MDRAQLLLAQWMSPGFPLGAFTYSQGLEQAFADGHIVDADDLHGWLSDLLTFGSGRSDAILIRAAYACDNPASLLDVDRIARAFAPARERLLETDALGAAFGRTATAIWDLPDHALSYPVALGHACRALDVPVDLAVPLYLHATIANLAGAAQRLTPLGQTRAQAIVAVLHATCIAVAQDTVDATLDDLASTSFMADIASMRHETLQPRIFRT